MLPAYSGDQERVMLIRSRRQFVRTGLGLAGLGLLSGCGILPPRPQEPVRVRRIGVLHDAPDDLWVAFRDALRELGHVEGENLSIEYRWTEAKPERNAPSWLSWLGWASNVS
jgi:hypothetical protein